MCFTKRGDFPTKKEALEARRLAKSSDKAMLKHLIQHHEFKKADKTIVCYKRLNKPKLKNGEKVYLSPHRQVSWRQQELKKAKLGVKLGAVYYSGLASVYPWSLYMDIHEGLHAHSTRSDAKFEKTYGEVILKAYIPKGAVYGKNHRGEIVATRMTLTEPVEKKVKKAVKTKKKR